MSDLLKINVNDRVEKKNGLSYLSWAWAWAEVLKVDPEAEWHAVDYTGADGQTVPYMVINGTAMVKTVVKIKGIERECLLPVMDHRNKAIKDPDAFQVNTAIMRCMTKAISMHGLGLYIYAGEDLPEGDGAPQPVQPPKTGAMADSLAALPKLSKEWEQYFDNLAEEVCQQFGPSKDSGAALTHIDAQDLNNDQKLHLWARLPSGVRTALTKAEDERRKECAVAQ